MDPVQHFELPYKSRDRAKKFYFDAFGWQLVDLPGSGYTLASSVATHANGMPTRPGAINGGLTPRSDLVQAPTFMIKVGSLKPHLDRIREHGGEILTEPVAMGPVIYARIRDTEGNVLAVFEDAPKDVREAQERAGKLATGKVAAPKPATAAKRSGLSPKQKAQRKYAASMRTVRARAKTTKGGKGRIAKRSSATNLRRKLGLKAGKASRKKR